MFVVHFANRVPGLLTVRNSPQGNPSSFHLLLFTSLIMSLFNIVLMVILALFATGTICAAAGVEQAKISSVVLPNAPTLAHSIVAGAIEGRSLRVDKTPDTDEDDEAGERGGLASFFQNSRCQRKWGGGLRRTSLMTTWLRSWGWRGGSVRKCV